MAGQKAWIQPACATSVLCNLDATGALLALDEMWKLQAVDGGRPWYTSGLLSKEIRFLIGEWIYIIWFNARHGMAWIMYSMMYKHTYTPTTSMYTRDHTRISIYNYILYIQYMHAIDVTHVRSICTDACPLSLRHWNIRMQWITLSVVADCAAQAEVNVFHISAVVAACGKERTFRCTFWNSHAWLWNLYEFVEYVLIPHFSCNPQSHRTPNGKLLGSSCFIVRELSASTSWPSTPWFGAASLGGFGMSPW